MAQSSAYNQQRRLRVVGGGVEFGKMPGFGLTLKRGLPPTHRVELQGAVTWKNTSAGKLLGPAAPNNYCT